MAEKEGIPALAPIDQSDTDAQTINIVSVHRSETQPAMLGAMLAPMVGGGVAYRLNGVNGI
jgi:hypothetical protein